MSVIVSFITYNDVIKLHPRKGKISHSLKHFNDTESLTNENARKRHVINSNVYLYLVEFRDFGEVKILYEQFFFSKAI
jgi:hypothetical protein